MNPTQETGIITNILEVAPGYHELTFQPSRKIEAIPGQFLQIAVSGQWDPLLRRPLSIFDLTEEGGECKILFKVTGRGTGLLGKFQIGSPLDYIGPLGNGFTLYPGSPQELLVAGGIGIAPLHFLARVLRGSGSEVVLLLGTETDIQLPALSSLKSMGVRVERATTDGSTGHKGTVTGLLAGYLQQNTVPTRLYCCGPRPMIEKVVKLAARHRIPVQASHEERMACGIGVCMGCAFHHPEDSSNPGDYNYYQRLCLDGPVISYSHHR